MATERYQAVLEAAYFGDFPKVRDGYVEVPTDLFVGTVDLGMTPPPDVGFYVLRDGNVQQIRKADQPFSVLTLGNYETILILEEDLNLVQAYAEAQLLSSRNSGGLSTEDRVSSLRRVAIRSVEDLFENPNPAAIKKGQKVVGSFVYLMMRDPRAFFALCQLSSHDPYTLQHSVGTSVNAIILTRRTGVTDQDLLTEAGLAGLLHDIGKVEVPKEIINKPGPLNDSEWIQMREHSAKGFELIKRVPGLSDRTKLAVLEHHEDKVGTGYPNGLEWDEIGSLSKVVGISDIFNALTTTRSYAEARTPYDAFQLMQSKLHQKIDFELFRNLVLVYGGKIDDL